MAAMAFAMAGMMNGERAVVLLFISRVLFSLTISLLALSLDILTDSSTSLSQFSTRPGASSGILLGAAALPTVFISKTIQLSLAVSLHQVSIEELESLTIRYWAASASCLCVLIFLCITISCASGNIAPPSRSIRHAKFSLSCIILHNAVCCLTLGTVSLTSKGACLVTSGLVLYFGDILAYTIEKMKLIASGLAGNPSFYFMQGLLLGLLFPMAFKFVLKLNPASLDLSFGAALAVFLALEIIRVWRIWRLGQSVHKFMNAFTDHRDSDLLIVRYGIPSSPYIKALIS
ncbi:hypothetical protein DVH24_038913 [Malus domestica]|uniref:dolichol kinase n=1 Tax=Malus domestica TaxID=3750 RepID=A0A498K8M8_MALDO|nr:hypothetical protein DVH24_038913 [Malus domestica]